MVERYTISVYDNVIEIHGRMHISEAINFLNYAFAEGYDCVDVGQDNSTLYLTRHLFNTDGLKEGETKDDQ